MNIAIILAGGVGSRMKTSLPKQYLKIYDKPILYYSLNTFNAHPKIDQIIVVCQKEYQDNIQNLCKENNFRKVRDLVEGGSTRQESTFNALKYLKEQNTSSNDIILIHDAARPLVSKEIIEENIKACLKYSAVNTAIEVKDTIFISENKKNVTNSLDRNKLMASQTPQTFRFDLIYHAHKLYKNENITDDVQLILKMNHPVSIVKGNEDNFKITDENDLIILSCKLNK